MALVCLHQSSSLYNSACPAGSASPDMLHRKQLAYGLTVNSCLTREILASGGMYELVFTGAILPRLH